MDEVSNRMEGEKKRIKSNSVIFFSLSRSFTEEKEFSLLTIQIVFEKHVSSSSS